MFRAILTASLLLAAVSGCRDSSGDGADQAGAGQYWLQSCTEDVDCGDLSCVSEICTLACDDDEACRAAGENARCVRRGSEPYRALLACRRDAPVAICLPRCGEANTCRDGFECLRDACVEQSAARRMRDYEEQGDGMGLFFFTYVDTGQILTENGECLYETTDGDGRLIYRRSATYDADGNLTSEGVDLDGTNRELSFTHFTHDSFGRVLTRESDDRGDCTPNLRITYTYDEFGNRIRTETDEDLDGAVDSVSWSDYDQNCRVLRFTADEEADGSTDRIDTYERDGEGRLQAVFSLGSPSPTDKIENYTYDTDGNLLVLETDYNGDGIPDERATATYDAEGNILTLNQELLGPEGALVSYGYSVYSYDAEGRLTAQSLFDPETGELSYETTHQYDEAGRVTRVESGSYSNGDEPRPEDKQIILYTYDARGQRKSIETQSPPGEVETRNIYAYDCDQGDAVKCSVDRTEPENIVVDDCAEPAELGHPPSELGREADPVVLSGDAVEPLLGRDPARLVGFRHQGSWEQVPIQVDERAVIDLISLEAFTSCDFAFADGAESRALLYVGAGTHTGPDPEPLLDGDDEITFMLADAGSRPATLVDPPGVVSGSGVEVAVSSPDDGEEVAYLYLFTGDGSLQQGAGSEYGSYAFSLDAGAYPEAYDFCGAVNPEDSWFRSDHYQRHFSDRVLSDQMRITASGASGVDILDRHDNDMGLCATVPGFDLWAMLGGTGSLAVNKRGPVRSIRSFVGASGGMRQTHLFYRSREDIITYLKIPAAALGENTDPLITAAKNDLLDHSSEATGMKYYNCSNPQGVTIDGVPDGVAVLEADQSAMSAPDADKYAWELVTGVQGSLVSVFAPGESGPGVDLGYQVTGYYTDDASATSFGSECNGDDGALYGMSGITAAAVVTACPEPDCVYDNEARRIMYYLPPGITVSDARQLSRHVYHPPEVTVASVE